jgi:hypothetical protein
MEILDRSFPIFFFKIPHRDGTSLPLGAGAGKILRRSSRATVSANSERSLLMLTLLEVEADAVMSDAEGRSTKYMHKPKNHKIIGVVNNQQSESVGSIIFSVFVFGLF